MTLAPPIPHFFVCHSKSEGPILNGNFSCIKQYAEYLNSIGLGDEEPFVEMNLTNLQSMVNSYGEISYKVRSVMDGKSQIVDIKDKIATFTFSGKVGSVVFTSICVNDSENACEITYPAPNQTGFINNYPSQATMRNK